MLRKLIPLVAILVFPAVVAAQAPQKHGATQVRGEPVGLDHRHGRHARHVPRQRAGDPGGAGEARYSRGAGVPVAEAGEPGQLRQSSSVTRRPSAFERGAARCRAPLCFLGVASARCPTSS